MPNDAMDTLRATLRAFCPTGKETVTVPQLAEALGLTTESQKQLLRRRLSEMAHRGEAHRVGRGEFVRVANWKPVQRGDGYTRMWRAIRVQDAGWKRQDIALIANMDATAVGRYLRWLKAEGLIAACGRRGNTTLWRMTAKGRDYRNAPCPPPQFKIPVCYEAERKATAQLCRILLREDPENPRTRKKIQEQLAVLTARFCTTGADTPQITEA